MRKAGGCDSQIEGSFCDWETRSDSESTYYGSDDALNLLKKVNKLAISKGNDTAKSVAGERSSEDCEKGDSHMYGPGYQYDQKMPGGPE